MLLGYMICYSPSCQMFLSLVPSIQHHALANNQFRGCFLLTCNWGKSLLRTILFLIVIPFPTHSRHLNLMFTLELGVMISDRWWCRFDYVNQLSDDNKGCRRWK
ncbi:hypothetical protein QN277_006021 [Acacia crassicarpa]|uniref:Uncharacterized protein n=1 Tax=Acacia crassicarpa TaxID=499986 RepID=A0AAE1MAC0_9FABA|nr:hypothetical protein QN277_006021 [Acacia crassicarpa]